MTDPIESAPAGVATTYAELIELLEKRRRDLRLSQMEMDERAGLGTSHYSHLVSWDTKYGRNMGPGTLAKVLDALGVGLVVVSLCEPEKGDLN
ncbi:MAG: helix-turn-helix transcriptional regulator, partial [Pseudomonadota bacterium]